MVAMRDAGLAVFLGSNRGWRLTDRAVTVN